FSSLRSLLSFAYRSPSTASTFPYTTLFRSTRGDDALMWLGISRGIVMRLAPASLALILVSGLYMMATTWGPRGWILVALASQVVDRKSTRPNSSHGSISYAAFCLNK